MRLLLVTLLLTAALEGQVRTTIFPPVRGTREMVAAANNQEVEAGYRILTQGGNAIDAGVAAVLAAAVTEQSRFGLGGEMPLLVKLGDRPVEAISGVGTAPALATVEYYTSRDAQPWETAKSQPPIPAQGILAATVPGVFDGLILALSRHGTLSFAEVAEPAIEYAEGFPIAEEFAAFLADYQVILNLWPTAKRFHFPDGRVPRRGEIVRYPDLARTLRELAAVERKTQGGREAKLEAVRDHFYKGDLARRIAASSEEYGGLIRYEDLAGFKAETDQPVSTTYRGFEILKPGFWTQGPALLQILNILEGYDLRAMGHNSAEYIHTVVEAMKLGMADRDAYYGDPKFSEIPAERLLSKEYAAERRQLIARYGASVTHRPGDVGLPIRLKQEPGPGQTTDQDTTCVNVVDRQGNLFNATPSGAWLPAVIAGDTGVPFGTRLQSFVLDEGHANQLAPGKRPRVTLTPTTVLKDGKAYMITSTPGGDNQEQALLQVILNMIDFGMTAQEAVEAPRFQSQHFHASFGTHDIGLGVLLVESRVPAGVRDQLIEKGHKLRVQGDWGNSSAPTVIHLRDGVLDGGADPRRARFVFGR